MRAGHGHPQQPAGRAGTGDDQVGAALLQQRYVLVLPDRHHDRGVPGELACRQGDECGGVVPLGRHDHARGALQLGPGQGVGAGRVAVHRHETVTAGGVHGGLLRIDHDDLLSGDALSEQGLDGAAALGPVSDDDDVISHAGPPAVDAYLVPGARGEDFERGADQNDQEQYPERRDDQDVGQACGVADRSDVAVAGGREGDRRVVGRAEEGDLVVGVVAVPVALEPDDQGGDGQHRQRHEQPAQHLLERRCHPLRGQDDGAAGLRVVLGFGARQRPERAEERESAGSAARLLLVAHPAASS
ncbi:hypothetical protein BX264_3485 [Streptomyces sp. 2333.5]|nr:hypothetical protein BX264_3485 [Streptomyces sp. 2333.5]SED57563.1 hypothetical protein SAMN05428943_3925 [Streptomyces sp. 2314.4]SEE31297.1 hypothetical protein SAMN05428942_3587 [Streptomyces sp. 2112.2]